MVDSLHRNVSLLAMVFLVLHILTSVLDSFASISIIDAFVPFVGSYRPFWLGLGAVAFDLLLAVIITSLLRARMGFATWRTVHWLAYASWPIALVHGFGTGSDANSTWLLALSIGCMAVVLAAVLTRVIAGWPENIRLRSAAARRRRRLLAVHRAVAAERPARLRMGAPLGHARLAARPLPRGRRLEREPTMSSSPTRDDRGEAPVAQQAAPRAAAPAGRHPRRAGR